MDGISAYDELAARLAARLADLLEPQALARARRVAAEAGERLDRAVTRLGLLPERRLAELLAGALDLSLVPADAYPERPLLPEAVALRFQKAQGLMPLAFGAEGLDLAMADPLDREAIRAVALATGLAVRVLVAVPAELEAALERQIQTLGEGEAGGDLAEIGEDDVARLRDVAFEAPVVRLVNQLLARALDLRASDVHLEPQETRLRVRYRVDGALREQEAMTRNLAPAVISRIKLLARLDIAERRLPQDGRIKLVLRGREVDFRVATTPTLHGEAVVLRILDGGQGAVGFEALGLDGPPAEAFFAQLERPNGIILVTGPTGSGKTTTLYSALSRLNRTERKVLTVEDPVEYELPGVNQIQVKPDIGLDFATVLRATLRHDPDIVMVGEIRDGETAQVAVQAALTGHLVLSTLHTNSASATLVRLLDIGIAEYLVASTLVCIVAQRLVRRLCPDCREPWEPSMDLMMEMGLDRLLPRGTFPQFWRPKGCPSCRGSGYVGRLGIYEVLIPDAKLRRAVSVKADATTLQELAVEAGMRTLRQDGLIKALAGQTSLEEVWRATTEG